MSKRERKKNVAVCVCVLDSRREGEVSNKKRMGTTITQQKKKKRKKYQYKKFQSL